MTIDIYSKQGCGICDAAKDKMGRLGLEYQTHDLLQVIEPHQGWREDGSIEVLAAYALLNNKLPVIKIDAEFHDYPSAMKRLKTLNADQARTSDSGSEAVH